MCSAKLVNIAFWVLSMAPFIQLAKIQNLPPAYNITVAGNFPATMIVPFVLRNWIPTVYQLQASKFFLGVPRFEINNICSHHSLVPSEYYTMIHGPLPPK
jgi:hypothetical protein